MMRLGHDEPRQRRRRNCGTVISARLEPSAMYSVLAPREAAGVILGFSRHPGLDGTSCAAAQVRLWARRFTPPAAARFGRETPSKVRPLAFIAAAV